MSKLFRTISMQSFADKYELSDQAQDLLKKQLQSDHLYTEKFTFSREEFSKHIAFQSIELDNGGILTAEASSFNDVFSREELGGAIKRFSTQGTIVDQKLKSGR